jgi:hypothetical protein
MYEAVSVWPNTAIVAKIIPDARSIERFEIDFHDTTGIIHELTVEITQPIGQSI